jgi:CTP synthase (UTP-ammonia lyase)
MLLVITHIEEQVETLFLATLVNEKEKAPFLTICVGVAVALCDDCIYEIKEVMESSIKAQYKEDKYDLCEMLDRCSKNIDGTGYKLGPTNYIRMAENSVTQVCELEDTTNE